MMQSLILRVFIIRILLTFQAPQKIMKSTLPQIETSDKVLVTVRSPGQLKALFLNNKQSTSFYVPKDSSVHFLMNHLSDKLKMNQKDSFFLFGYGSILNNHQKIGSIFEKYKHKVSQVHGLEIEITQMSTFGFGSWRKQGDQ